RTDNAACGDGTRRARQARSLAPEAGPKVEPTGARRRVEVAGRVAVDAELLRHRQPAARDDRHAHLDRPLEAAIAARRPAPRNAQRRRHQLAVGRARVAGRAVGRPVVALLAAVDGAVAALEAAGGGAAVARRGVAVVARLTELRHAVAADRGIRLAGELQPVGTHAMARGI